MIDDVQPKIEPIVVQKPALSDLVLERLISAIGDGALEQGAKLRDAELAASLHVSRMPVRQALQRLEQIGLIESSPSRFTRVVTVTKELAEETIAFAGYAGGVLLRTKLPEFSDRERAVLIREVADLGLVEDPATLSDVVRDVLRRLIDTGATHFLGRMLDRSLPAIWCNVRRYDVPVDQTIHKEAVDELSASIRSSDAAAAETAMRRLFRLPV
ncbi:GntR family transcriptional regulator [Microbacterium stercoris]|uniref:GntR family transcriptional regulator n=1 Tax=Microbacterium stercoris TaxID=2820289 RepID=UPI0027DB010C|nr:GntR family transcriptional regulator [Microbacterium stercoris]